MRDIRSMINLAVAIQAAQLVDSSLPETRLHWRRLLGFPDDIAADPRPLHECVAAQEREA